MGNVWCCHPNRYIIDYIQRKVVISQGVQCSLLIPSAYCPHICVPKPTCSPERHCRCGIYSGSGDWQPSCYRNEGNNKNFGNSFQTTLKSKLHNSHRNYMQDHPDALVSLSETFSESSLEEFLSRKRITQNKDPVNNVKLLNCLRESQSFDFSTNSSFPKALNSVTEFSAGSKSTRTLRSMNKNYRKNRPKRRKIMVHKTQMDSSSNNSPSTENSFLNIDIQEAKFIGKKNELNNSAETTSIEDSKKASENPKKSILKNSDAIKEANEETPSSKEKQNSNRCSVIPQEKTSNLSLHSDKYSIGSLPNRSLSAMSNHDSLEQLMSLLKSSTFTATEDGQIRSKKCKSIDCINKSVNFTRDVNDLKQYGDFHQKPNTKSGSGYQMQSDGKIKKRLILRETHRLFDILNDPNDRRIRAICDRYQCDLEIFVRPPKIGLMYFAVEILAPDKYALRMCVRELDSSMKWCISSQLF